jgi:hypothetical protein
MLLLWKVLIVITMGSTNDNNLNRIITIRKHITYLKFAIDNYLVLGSMCPNLITLITLNYY